MPSDYQAVITAPFGKLGVRMNDDRLTGLDFLAAEVASLPPADEATRSVCQALANYFADGASALDLDFHLHGTPFQQRVWQHLRSIPAGRTQTYGELALCLGSGPRAVANACGANPLPIIVPCHRVVAKHGLGGFMHGRTAGALQIKQWLLQHERSRSTAA